MGMKRKIAIGALIVSVGAILGVAATIVLIVGLVLEYKVFSDPNWPIKKKT